MSTAIEPEIEQLSPVRRGPPWWHSYELVFILVLLVAFAVQPWAGALVAAAIIVWGMCR